MTGVGGAAVGGFLLPVLQAIIEALSTRSPEYLVMLPLIIIGTIALGLPIIVEALPYTILGTIILFFPSCIFFGRKRTTDLLMILVMGVALGLILVIVINHYQISIFMPRSGLHETWVGAYFGVVTGYFGWSLMEAKETGKYDG